MKTLFATVIVALGVMTSVAQAAGPNSPYAGYPDWARDAFDRAY